jgi:hypothetical protein
MLLSIFENYQEKSQNNYPFYNEGALTIDQHFLNFYKKNIERFNKLKYTYIPVCWTDLYISRLNDKNYFNNLQKLINDTTNTDQSNDKKYFTVVQHAIGIKQQLPNNTIIFGAGSISPNTIQIPLICQNKITDSPIFRIINQKSFEKDIFCSFIGSSTHQIRQYIYDKYKNNEGYLFNIKKWEKNCSLFDQTEFIETTLRSKFTLCPRGFGVTSFRLFECMQLGSIPVYIYDQPHLPYSDIIDWNKICVLIHASEIDKMDLILKSISDETYKEMLSYTNLIYNDFFTLDKVPEYIYNFLLKLNG